jgi:hypothetical protein
VVGYHNAPGPPGRYSDPHATPLRVEVPEGGARDLELVLDDPEM